MRPVTVIDLGVIEYRRAHTLQQRLVGQRANREINDTLLLLEHPHVYTKGRKSRDLSDLVDPGDVPVIDVERGGEITYHGPGQLVAYPIFSLEANERDAPAFIRRLEQWVIAALNELGVPGGYHNKGFSGVWIGDHKIASVGVAVTAQWITWHGIAINVSSDLSYFERINPCGLNASVMTSITELTQQSIEIAMVRDVLTGQMETHLGRRILG